MNEHTDTSILDKHKQIHVNAIQQIANEIIQIVCCDEAKQHIIQQLHNCEFTVKDHFHYVSKWIFFKKAVHKRWIEFDVPTNIHQQVHTRSISTPQELITIIINQMDLPKTIAFDIRVKNINLSQSPIYSTVADELKLMIGPIVECIFGNNDNQISIEFENERKCYRVKLIQTMEYGK